MINIYILPKDILWYLVKFYIKPSDYSNLLLSSRIFHVLSEKERTKKYKAVLYEKLTTDRFKKTVRKTFPNTNILTVDIQKLFTFCEQCGTIIKHNNNHKHTQKCKKGLGLTKCHICKWNFKSNSVDYASKSLCYYCNVVKVECSYCYKWIPRYRMWKHKCCVKKIMFKVNKKY